MMWEDEALAIEINNVSKQYKGGKVAVDDISFSVRDGEIFGFLGPNGAGKSTTLKMLTTILKPTSGTVRIKNIDVLKEPLKARMQFGYVPQQGEKTCIFKQSCIILMMGFGKRLSIY